MEVPYRTDCLSISLSLSLSLSMGFALLAMVGEFAGHGGLEVSFFAGNATPPAVM